MLYVIAALITYIVIEKVSNRNINQRLQYHKERGDYWSIRYEELITQMEEEFDREWWESWTEEDESL